MDKIKKEGLLFSQVIGQDRAKTALLKSVRENRLSHAMLFLAPEGAGGLPMAWAMAQYLVCENKNGEEACGVCSGCRKAKQLIHPDIHFSYPVITKKSGTPPISSDYGKEWREFALKNPYGNTFDWLQSIGAENKQGNITARECGEIIHKMNLKSYESEYKVMVIWRPEYLGAEGNRLLKLFEEPPPKTVFILVAEQTELLLNTILSRVQLIRLPALSRKELTEALVGKEHVDHQEAQRIAAFSDGNYDFALKLLNKETRDFMKLLRSWLNAILSKNPLLLNKWINQIGGAKMGREERKQFLRYFINQLENALKLEYIDPAQLAILPEEITFSENMNKLADFFQIEKIIQMLDAAIYDIERNVNGKILFHALSIRLRAILKRTPILL